MGDRLTSLGVLVLLSAGCGAGTNPDTEARVASAVEGAAAPDLSTREGRIASAISAAPADIARDAAVMDWGADGQLVPVRQGRNGWMCMPARPETPANDPMCLDKAWQDWVPGYMAHTEPPHGTVGVAYMLQGDATPSNSDPFAEAPPVGQAWVTTGPHVMILPAHPADLDGLPTDPNAGGPFVMWAHTPYAHLMVPVATS